MRFCRTFRVETVSTGERMCVLPQPLRLVIRKLRILNTLLSTLTSAGHLVGLERWCSYRNSIMVPVYPAWLIQLSAGTTSFKTFKLKPSRHQVLV